jgi:hypothetical protein
MSTSDTGSRVPPQSEEENDIYYILVQGSEEFGSHADQGMLIQLLWLLFLAGVKPTRVKVLYGQPQDLKDPPLLAPGKTPYQIPKDYADQKDPPCYQRVDAYMMVAISSAVAQACRLPGVHKIVLVYANHGSPVQVGGAGKVLRLQNFAQWGFQCAVANIEFLLVLDACCSTIFASSVWDTMRGLAPSMLSGEQWAFAEKHIGFITSASGVCTRSTAMISKDESLVNLFGAKEGEEEWARGLCHRSSMFLRQFNWLLAYGFGTFDRALHRDVTLQEFVTRMNLPCLCFHASIVAHQDFGSIQLRSFFPFPQLGTLGPDRPMARDWPGVVLGDLIPSARLGRLWDDLWPLGGSRRR